FPDLAALLDANLALDFVDIASPPQFHCAQTLLAVARGLPVLCQKPFATNLAEARAMIETCRRAGVILCINENWRWRAWYRAIKRMVAEGKIGKPIYLRFFCHGEFWVSHKKAARRDWLEALGRGSFFEWGIHHIDVARFLLGEPETVYARMARAHPDLRGEDRALVTLTFGKATALIDISSSSYAPYGHPNRQTTIVEDFRIEGDAGTIALIPDPVRGDLMRVTTADDEIETRAYDGAPYAAYLQSYIAAQSHFVECLHAGRTPETNGADNFKTFAAMLAAYRSAESNAVIRIQDFIAQESITQFAQ
ncbi:MAG: Gfo/Idh/MocA family oxidoreductase, partial [Anaerolineales bacterium]|nr:Gfo/Idh/MocA family oxidoreductase [Anaerolineales bacterium]